MAFFRPSFDLPLNFPRPSLPFYGYLFLPSFVLPWPFWPFFGFSMAFLGNSLAFL
jgi:hypothetical protein